MIQRTLGVKKVDGIMGTKSMALEAMKQTQISLGFTDKALTVRGIKTTAINARDKVVSAQIMALKTSYY
jgi:hypothetical protein